MPTPYTLGNYLRSFSTLIALQFLVVFEGKANSNWTKLVLSNHQAMPQYDANNQSAVECRREVVSYLRTLKYFIEPDFVL